MSWLLLIILTALLCIIAVQDIRHRLVSVWLFPCMLLVSATMRAGETTYQAVLKYTLVNSMIIIAQFAALMLFYRLKGIAFRDFFSAKLGPGDVLFLLAVTPLFHPANYVLFLTASLFLVLIFTLLLNSRKPDHTIPLAGRMALHTIMVLWIAHIAAFSLYNDTWIMSAISIL